MVMAWWWQGMSWLLDMQHRQPDPRDAPKMVFKRRGRTFKCRKMPSTLRDIKICEFYRTCLRGVHTQPTSGISMQHCRQNQWNTPQTSPWVTQVEAKTSLLKLKIFLAKGSSVVLHGCGQKCAKGQQTWRKIIKTTVYSEKDVQQHDPHTTSADDK